MAAFNESHDDIELVLEIVDYDTAFDVMSTQIAGGNAPDIVGPVGVSGAEAFHGQWLDLTDLIESTGYDTSQFSEGAVEFFNVGGEGQIGLPFASYPSMLFYHRDMFDEAGLEYPPHAYGDPYILDGEEVTWDMDTLPGAGQASDGRRRPATTRRARTSTRRPSCSGATSRSTRISAQPARTSAPAAWSPMTAPPREVPEHWADCLEVAVPGVLDRPHQHDPGAA